MGKAGKSKTTYRCSWTKCFLQVLMPKTTASKPQRRQLLLFNPLPAKGPFFGHTYNYVDCHRATFRPLVWREILNFLCYGIIYRKRICREKSLSNRIQHLALHLANYILCYGTKFECTVREIAAGNHVVF